MSKWIMQAKGIRKYHFEVVLAPEDYALLDTIAEALGISKSETMRVGMRLLGLGLIRNRSKVWGWRALQSPAILQNLKWALSKGETQ